MSGLIPSRIASVRTKVLNEEPAWRRPWAARLNWMFFLPGTTAVIARMAPFVGLMETSADAGSSGWFSVSLIASIGDPLEARVDRRVDLEPAAAHGVAPYLSIRSSRT